MALRRTRIIQWIPSKPARAADESAPSTISHISLDEKQTGKRSAGNPPAPFDEAGAGDVTMVEILRHSKPKGRETDENKHQPKAARQSSTLPPENAHVDVCVVSC